MLLIIDDDPSIRTSLGLLLKQAGYTTRAVADPEAALTALVSTRFDLVLQDMNFSRRTDGTEGLELLAAIKQQAPECPVVLMTAWGSIGLAVAGMRAGAADFVTKPWRNDQLLATVRTVLDLKAAGTHAVPIPSRAQLDQRYRFDNLVGEDPRFLEILALIGRVASTDAPVLITGESGTGKEGIAEALHENSDRQQQPFVKVNLGGMAANLFEAEMFGHTRGAFTDAHTARKGRFEMADGGTVFLDEVGDLERSCQVKLLRVLQDRTFEPLGSSKPLTVDVRVVSATNRPLADLVAAGEFREDLLYRLNLIAVHLPALRERRGDIPRLAQHFLARMAQVYNRADLSFSAAALDWLTHRDWPGNIRELKQMVERTVLVSNKAAIDVVDLVAAAEMTSAKTVKPRLPVGQMTLEEMERHMIEAALRRHDDNITQTAESLGLSRAALYRRLEKYGIDP